MGKRSARKLLDGVLSRQKPQKKRRSARFRISSLKLPLLLLLALCVAGAFSYFKPTLLSRVTSRQVTASTIGKSKISWKLVVRTTDERPLRDEQMAEIAAIVRDTVVSGKKSELKTASRLIVQRLALGVAAVTRSGKSGLVVSVSQRVPLLGVYADKARFLAEDGTVYGDYLTESDPGSPIGPVVTGIFDNRAESFTSSGNGALDLGAEEVSLLKETAELYKAIRTSNLKIKSMDFRRFRGFFVVLQNSETEVALGRSPFAGKLTRLNEILTRFEKTSSTAARIELDYQGKAFIKEKKL